MEGRGALRLAVARKRFGFQGTKKEGVKRESRNVSRLTLTGVEKKNQVECRRTLKGNDRGNIITSQFSRSRYEG